MMQPTSSSWPLWLPNDNPLSLVRYVRPAEVARHVQLPGRSGESRVARLRAVYATLAAKEIGLSLIHI